ncbi:MAG: hypothetical protein WC878_00050 [Candidatus Paceibacterota bacterium]|jgi:hypothetical protein
MNEEKLAKIIETLIAEGEDREELSYWLEIYPFLKEEKQTWLFKHLTEELSRIQSAKKLS